jgi:large conductance mechanosensitive channel
MGWLSAVVQEFKEFIHRGNVFDVAVGIVMALAFKPVVDTLVDGVIMQIVAAIVGEPDFRGLTINLREGAAIQYGAFLNTVISFLLISLVVFALVKGYNRLVRRQEREEAAEEAGSTEVELLTEIRDLLQASTAS